MNAEAKNRIRHTSGRYTEVRLPITNDPFVRESSGKREGVEPRPTAPKAAH
jgi:hypothetical protein